MHHIDYWFIIHDNYIDNRVMSQVYFLLLLLLLDLIVILTRKFSLIINELNVDSELLTEFRGINENNTKCSSYFNERISVDLKFELEREASHDSMNELILETQTI